MTDDLDLASLLASRLCHDVVGPVGAIQNGLELIAEDKSMTEMAMALIQKSAAQASAKLQFARTAYGAAGGADVLDPAEAGRLTAAMFEGERATLSWQWNGAPAGRVTVKLAMILATYALGAVPRGGEVTVEESDGAVIVTATGDPVREPAFLDVLKGGQDVSDPRAVPAALVQRLAKANGRSLDVEEGEGMMRFVTAAA